jgi:hypothetical protein
VPDLSQLTQFIGAIEVSDVKGFLAIDTDTVDIKALRLARYEGFDWGARVGYVSN